MTKVCCSALFTAMITRRLEWAWDGVLIVGEWSAFGVIPLERCPFCELKFDG